MKKDNWIISNSYKDTSSYKSIYEDSNYLNIYKNLLKDYKWSHEYKKEETEKEKEERLLREKATSRSNKIDLILKR